MISNICLRRKDSQDIFLLKQHPSAFRAQSKEDTHTEMKQRYQRKDWPLTPSTVAHTKRDSKSV